VLLRLLLLRLLLLRLLLLRLLLTFQWATAWPGSGHDSDQMMAIKKPARGGGCEMPHVIVRQAAGRAAPPPLQPLRAASSPTYGEEVLHEELLERAPARGSRSQRAHIRRPTVSRGQRFAGGRVRRYACAHWHRLLPLRRAPNGPAGRRARACGSICGIAPIAHPSRVG
jgi:hypothetical protein